MSFPSTSRSIVERLAQHGFGARVIAHVRVGVGEVLERGAIFGVLLSHGALANREHRLRALQRPLEISDLPLHVTQATDRFGHEAVVRTQRAPPQIQRRFEERNRPLILADRRVAFADGVANRGGDDRIVGKRVVALDAVGGFVEHFAHGDDAAPGLFRAHRRQHVGDEVGRDLRALRSSSACACARRARTSPTVASVVPASNATVIAEAAITPTRWRRMKRAARYRRPGGAASTGSRRRKRARSSASAPADW